MLAPVFKVVHGSVVDGWGIRSTIFLKGCPLRCRWCCNPESQSAVPELFFHPDLCDGCGLCIPDCPQNALTLSQGTVRLDRTRCDGCGKCTSACWQEALEPVCTLRSPQSIFEDCLPQRLFYLNSGGGVTLSGGEPTLHPQFCLTMIDLCHRAGISVAIDTCGHITTQAGREVLQRCDLVLLDVKGLDPVLYRRNTGVNIDPMLATLNALESMGKNVIIRCPIIPNHNAHESPDIAGYLSSLACVKRVDLIPYHTYGTEKYAQLGRPYPLNEPMLSQEDAEALLTLFRSKGLHAQLGG